MAKIDFYAKVKAMPTLEEYCEQREKDFLESHPDWGFGFDAVDQKEMKQDRYTQYSLDHALRLDTLKKNAAKAEDEYKQLKNRHAEELNELLNRYSLEESDSEQEYKKLLSGLGYDSESKDTFTPYLNQAEKVRAEKDEKQEQAIDNAYRSFAAGLWESAKRD